MTCVRRDRLVPVRPASAVLGLLVGLTGCMSATPAAEPRPSGEPASELRVGLADYEFALSSAVLADGAVTLHLTNVGATAHDLQVRAGRSVLATSELLAPGEQQTLTVDVSGSVGVTFVCNVSGHASMGMRSELAVGGPA